MKKRRLKISLGLLALGVISVVRSPETRAARPTQSIGLDLKQTGYLSEPVSADQYDSYSDLTMHYVLEGDDSDLRGKVDAYATFALRAGEGRYIYVPELFIARKLGPLNQYQLTLGRQRAGWSFFDETWGIGIWEPQYRRDYIDPVGQGLTGLFFRWRDQLLELQLLASIFHLPDQGPNFRLSDDGEITSANRWFQPPGRTAEIQGGESKIQYEMAYPQIQEVINHEVYAGRIRVGRATDGGWAQFAVASKPMNQLHVRLKSREAVQIHRNVMLAEIRPVVARHWLATAEAGYTGYDWNGWVSATFERPTPPPLPEFWEQAVLNRSAYYGVHLAQRLKWTGLPETQASLDLLLRQDYPIESEQGFMKPDLQSTMPRPPYAKAVSFGLRSRLVDRQTKKLNLNLSYLYEWEQKGGLLRTGAEYQADRQWTWTMGFDVMGVTEKKPSAPIGFFDRFKGNDRVYGGVSYVF